MGKFRTCGNFVNASYFLSKNFYLLSVRFKLSVETSFSTQLYDIIREFEFVTAALSFLEACSEKLELRESSCENFICTKCLIGGNIFLEHFKTKILTPVRPPYIKFHSKSKIVRAKRV